MVLGLCGVFRGCRGQPFYQSRALSIDDAVLPTLAGGVGRSKRCRGDTRRYLRRFAAAAEHRGVGPDRTVDRGLSCQSPGRTARMAGGELTSMESLAPPPAPIY